MLEQRRAAISADGETRRSRFMRSYEMMKSIDANEADKMLAAFEKTEEVYARQAAAIAAGDYDGLEAAGERGLAMVGRPLVLDAPAQPRPPVDAAGYGEVVAVFIQTPTGPGTAPRRSQTRTHHPVRDAQGSS